MSNTPEKSLLVQGYEVVIGFETHTQLTTQSKIFSRAPTAFGAEPNTQASAVDFALPGALPVMNKGAVQRAIEFGLAVNAHIAESSVFARKNYFYPDLPKGYQISQFEIPVVQGGSVEFFLDGEKKSVRLVRAHLEEDAGKSLHEDFIGLSGIDLNRAGTPLLEIVTEPDMRSSQEAVAYAKELHKIVTWIGICDGNMQEGSFRCDANVSVRKPGAVLGTRREIKNLNSFKFMQQAMDYEVRWQINEIEEGRTIQVDARQAREILVQGFAGVFLQVRAHQPDRLFLFTEEEFDAAALHHRDLELADLVALGQIGVEVIFAGKDAFGCNVRAHCQTELDGALHRPSVHDGQRAGQCQVHSAGLGVGLGAERGRGAAENLGFCCQLGVGFKADDDFVALDQKGVGGLAHVAVPGAFWCQSVAN